MKKILIVVVFLFVLGLVVAADIMFDDQNLFGNDMFNITNVNTTYVNVANITLAEDSTNHIIYDNSTCIILSGDTSTLYIC